MQPATIPIDDLVRTSDDAAVRSAFDAKTLTWLRMLAIVGVIATFPHMLSGMMSSPTRGVAGALSFALALALLAAVRASSSTALAAFVRSRVRAVAVGTIIAEVAVLMVFYRGSEAGMAVAVVIALMTLGFRLLPAERILLHASIVGVVSLLGVLLPRTSQGAAETVMPTLAANVMVMMGGLFIARRARREVINDWNVRRTYAREQIRMRDELLYARELQLAMLPECAPTLDWLDWCGASIPATEVGGDYYDYFVDEDRVAIVSSDVAGHGLASGLVLAALRSGFTLLRDSLDDPSAVLTRLHDLVSHTSRKRLLATAAVLLIDRKAQRATVASAGHPPILLLRDGRVSPIEIFAPPLGVRLPIQIPQTTIDLRPGDTFIVHSDGIYETRNAAGEEYGLERLAAVAAANASADAVTLRNAIVEDVESFRGGATQDDDVTIVVCRVAGV